MQLDFHYYATYCAACIAGFNYEESCSIAYSAQFVDCCTRSLLHKIGAPGQAATTQLQSELLNATTDLAGLQDITRIWASFHFLPGNLYARRKKKCSKRFLRKYQLICRPNGELLAKTVELAKDKGPQAAGLAMHVLADTWAHSYFAGTPSLAINNTNSYFYEIYPSADGFSERAIRFNHNPSTEDVPEKGFYTNSLYQGNENSIMNLGHGRAGHLPDYSWARYRYLPSWGGYREIIKNNPSDYFHAFCQMVYALRYLKGDYASFKVKRYDVDSIWDYRDRIIEIIETRQLDSSDDWRKLGAEISGHELEPFDIEKYQQEYVKASPEVKDDTFLGRFILAALAQKSMVTGKIFTSGSMLAGIAVDFETRGFRGIRDFQKLVEERAMEAAQHDADVYEEEED